ncbi:DJ-1/PfpI family protein [Clostridium sp. MSJ-11]|uniref:DJ-1/PfpI family protein n=1 Tax=Clostridium mobile TaxID=2841512 RepID=A0ABS6ED40_9CLOT|nr:DJ-1 family glyoxalase III [Clostridium mobile]MBU5483109.1 DJ-1/PfpI family protein [Clostridium mobile]
MKRVLVLLADGFEEIEALTVVDVLRRGGVICHLCSMDEEDMVRGTHNIYVKCDVKLDHIKINTYDGVVLPGGMPGASNLKDDYRVIELIKKYDREEKIIAAICAAPIILQEAGVLKGKEITSYPSFENEFSESVYVTEKVVQWDNIITSRGPSTALDFSFRILENFATTKEVNQLKEDMLLTNN